MRKYVDEFMRQREGWKELEKHRLEEENQRILDFAKLQAEREHARQMARKEAEEMRSEIVKQVGVILSFGFFVSVVSKASVLHYTIIYMHIYVLDIIFICLVPSYLYLLIIFSGILFLFFIVG